MVLGQEKEENNFYIGQEAIVSWSDISDNKYGNWGGHNAQFEENLL